MKRDRSGLLLVGVLVLVLVVQNGASGEGTKLFGGKAKKPSAAPVPKKKLTSSKKG